MKKPYKIILLHLLFLSPALSSRANDLVKTEFPSRFGLSVGYSVIGRESITYKVSIDRPNTTLESEAFPVKGPFTIKAEYYVLPKITIGCDLFYSIYKIDSVTYFSLPPITTGFKGNAFTALIRVNNYFKQSNSKDPVDFYLGLGLGLKYNKLVPDDSRITAHYSDKEAAFELSVGFKAYILKGVGLYTECGLSSTTTFLFNFGVTAKI